MSVKDLNKSIIISNATTGQVILNELMYDGYFSSETIDSMIKDIINNLVWDNEMGVLIKIGYKS